MPKKILVTAAWKDEFAKLQTDVLQIPILQEELKQAREETETFRQYEAMLNKYKEEYKVMMQDSKEATTKAKDLQSRNLELAKQVKKFRDDKEKVRANTRRLERLLKEEQKKYGKATAEIASLFRKLQQQKAEYEQEVKNRNHFAEKLKEESKHLEREREQRLQDIHMKSLDRMRIEGLEAAKNKLEKAHTMDSSLAATHTHESAILTKALECSRHVSEMYEERLVMDDDEIADLKIRNAKLQRQLEGKEAQITANEEKNAAVKHLLRAVQAYALTLAKTSTDYEHIMQPPRQWMLRTANEDAMALKDGEDGSWLPGGQNPAAGWGDAESGAELIVRRDMEPPLSQAPTYSSLVKHFEGLKASRRLQRMPEKDDDGNEVSFSLAGPGKIPIPESSEKPGFFSSQYRFMADRKPTEVSDTTLRQVQPPMRASHTGLQLADTFSPGRPARATDVNGLPPVVDTFYSPGGTGDVSLPSAASAPNLGGLTPDGFRRKTRKHIKSHSERKPRASPLRTDGKSVADSAGSMYISTGIGIKRTKIERKLKGSAKHMLNQIINQIQSGGGV